MHMLALSRRILDRTCKQEEFMGGGAKRRLVKDDRIPILGIAGLLPGRQVLGDERPELGFREWLSGVKGRRLGHV